MATNVDPVSGKPVGMTQQDREEKKERREENLRSIAAFGGELFSPNGQDMVLSVRLGLLERIETLIADDPEAKVYADILKRWGLGLRLAKWAENELTKKWGITERKAI